MPNFNQQTLVGHTGSDVPPPRYTQTGRAVTDVNVAYTRKRGGEKVTFWTKVTFWDKLAEVAAQYLKKGNAVLISGEPGEPDCWADKQTGAPRCRATLTAQNMTLLGGATEARDGAADGQHGALSDWAQGEDLGPLAPMTPGD